MNFFHGDFFEFVETQQAVFDGIISDPPYHRSTATNCPVKGRLGGPEFSNTGFFKAAERVTKDDAFLIVFCNFLNAVNFMTVKHHMILEAEEIHWKFCANQVWDKRPTRTWISWQKPLRHTEHILYFSRGDFRFDFRTGKLKPPVKRKSFGGALKASAKANDAKVSQEMFEEIVTFRAPRGKNKIHPTQKPEEFSEMFAKIVGADKLVLDPFCGSGALLRAFPRSLGIDVKVWE